ncbi:MAG: glycoside hydrolase family 3 C-terminal domain-containing protein [Bacteroidales bacterium]|nr:glycoside hydrolase family 3 C-terminal domain-containing protein [Bacteroidales bacterium]
MPAPGERVSEFDLGSSEIYHEGWIDFNKNGVMDVYEDPTADLDARIEDLLSQMTLDEKTCQMVTLYGYGRILEDDLPTPGWKERLWKDGVGAIDEQLNGFPNSYDNPNVWPASRHAWAMNTIQRFFVEETRLGIPTDFTNEGIRGVESYHATNFPTQLGLGHTWDRDLIHEIGYITGREGRLLGYTNVYAPIMDVGRDQRWGRYEEIYGESPYLIGELAVSMTQGMQTDYQVASTGKHFLGYSNNKGAREGEARTDPQMSRHEMENIHTWAWREVISRAGMLGVMACYNDYDSEPIEGSHYWLYDRLRDDFGFRGYVVSDSEAVEYQHTKHHTTADMKGSVCAAVMAGLNVRCTFRSPDSYVLPIRELVEEGTLPIEVVDDRVRDILRVKFLVGLFDDPYQRDYAAADAEVDSPEHNAVALRASLESLVLLKNDDSRSPTGTDGKALPLNLNNIRKVAVVGPNADETSYVNAHYGPRTPNATSVYGGLKARLNGIAEVNYAKGCELVDSRWPISEIVPIGMNDEEKAQMAEAVDLVKASDVAVVVVGGGLRTCGESKSRTSLDLPGFQEDLLKAVEATGKPMIVVLINGRPLSVNWADLYADAIVEAWYPGAHGGEAVAQVLCGDYNPGGKLTVTFPRTVGQIPLNFPYKPNSQIEGGTRPGPDGNQSRINTALYDFGYGLSYTTFEYSDLQLSSGEILPDGKVDVSFNVTNTGSREGDEIVQLYVTDLVTSVTYYEKVLRGFDRIHLQPGETKRVSFTLDAYHDLSLLDKDLVRVVEPGEFEIIIGASSTDVRLKKTLTVLSPEGQRVHQPTDASLRLPVLFGEGDSVDFAMKDVTSFSELSLEWGDVKDCRFRIEAGRRILYEGAAEEGLMLCKFDPLHTSSVRITVTSGSATLTDLFGVAVQ